MFRKLLLGVGPWILFSLVVRFGSLEQITLAWVCFFALQLTLGWKYLAALNPLSWVSLVAFALLFINSYFQWYLWAIVYAAQICYGLFALTGFITVLLNRPFTMTHARLTTPQEFWKHPLFLTINRRVSLYWSASFAVNGTVMLLEHQYSWPCLITTYLVLASAIIFSDRYPVYLREKAMQQLAKQQKQTNQQALANQAAGG